MKQAEAPRVPAGISQDCLILLPHLESRRHGHDGNRRPRLLPVQAICEIRFSASVF